MPLPLLVLFQALLSNPFSLFDAWDAVVTVQLNLRVHALREAGDPVTLLELAKTYPDPPPGQNAAPVLQRAFDLAEKHEPPPQQLPIVGAAQLPEPSEELPAPMRVAIQEYLKDHAEVLQLLHEAAGREGCKFDLDFKAGLGMLLPHLARIRQGARLLALEAVERTEAGQGDAAADSLIAGLRLAGVTKNEPILISSLVRIASNAIIVGQVERWASRARPTPEALARVEAALRAEADPKLVERAMIGERCFGMDAYQTYVLQPKDPQALAALGIPDLPPGLLRVIPRAYFKSDLLAYLDIMGQYITAIRKPYPQSLIEAAQVGKTLEQRIPRYYVMARMLLPALGRCFTNAQQHTARLESARVALAALRYRARHGKLPDKLDALVPGFLDAVPLDAFTAKPLLYRAAAEGFVVYAVGENGADDGGQTAGGQGQAPDTGFRVRWPKAEF
jgi:hypothetical protein